MTKKIIAILFLTCFTISARAALSLKSHEDYIVQSSKNADATSFDNTINLVTNEASGADSSNPIKVYVPLITDTNDTNQLDYSILNDNALPRNTTGTISLNLEVNNDTDTTYYLYAAVKSDKDGEEQNYKILTNPKTIDTNNFYDQEITLEFNIDRICATDIPENACDITNPGSSSFSNSVRIFYSTVDTYDTSADDDDIVETELAKVSAGLFYTFYFSDKPPDSGITSFELEMGDKRITAIYDGEDIDDYYNSVIFKLARSTDVPANLTYQALLDADPNGGALYLQGSEVKFYDEHPSGEFDITGLENGNTYRFAMAFVNNYLFATTFSQSDSANTEEIEAFLKKHACYLISAGYQKEHYVLDYFRKFRDNVLLKYSLGRKLVNWYYQTAPLYAPYIYNNKTASAVVRGVAHSLYLIMNNILIALGLILTLFVLLLGSMRRLRPKR
ncbi:MAG: hypothetical protein ISR65_00625 [Bacteriovoracaceae bacterium]|nr:hypothetical protein [Bacteriovoracaceae bacterium]